VDTTLQDPLVGRELDGRYTVRSRIARGGMATVYLALDRRLDREVAVKVMHAHLADDEQFTARFVREARAAARLSHPNVVQVYDQGADGDLLYLAMEHLRGRTLRDVLAERRVLTPREALTVLDPVLDALAAAHRHGIVHRDVKPENVILTDDGRVKVADFGLARAATANTSTSGVLMGTVAYLAPELVVRGIADARSDVYAAGIMMFEMLTGRQPFSGEVPIQVAYQHVNEQVPAPSTFVPGLPATLDDVILGATAREPNDRPDDAGELLIQLRAARNALSAEQLDTRPAPPPPGTSSSPGTVGAATEVFDSPPAQHRTQALPDLLARRTPPVPGTAPRSADRDAPSAGSPTGSSDDDALLALRHRRRVVGVVSLLTVLAVALGLTGAAWYFALGPGAYTTTPTVTGLQAQQATLTLRSKGLRSTQADVYDDATAVGVVVSTDPGAGRPVRKDAAVQLRISKGPEFVLVPGVVGTQQDAARTALNHADLTVGNTQQAYSDKPKGVVVSVDPTGGQRVHNGDTVTLTVSKGPQPVDVPTLTGRTSADAESALHALRLVAVYAPGRYDDTAPAGTVLSQTPSQGTLLPGQKVTLVLSKGPELIAVPSVVGRQIGDARSVLEGLGFQVRRSNILGGFFGTVRVQDPPGGSKAPKGSTITLTVV
jgi:beta-lactam-binding protein with PASTA domain/tRNA A-37 threonylcarbamoyl transferase component Bud32